MTKQLFLAVGCLALLTMFTSAVMADEITFTFTHDPTSNAVDVSAGSLTQDPADDVTVKNGAGLVFNIGPGSNPRGQITSTNGTYTASSSSVIATYAGGAPGITQVVVTGGVGGICSTCLQGETNAGTYNGFQGGVGDFSGNFHVTFVSSAILGLFGDASQKVEPIGSDSFTSSQNVIGPTSTSALFESGQITIETTTVPEPASLALLGSAILGVAARIRRKR